VIHRKLHSQGFESLKPGDAALDVRPHESRRGQRLQGFESLKPGDAALDVIHEDAFRQFEFKKAWFEASLLQDRANAFEEVLGTELYPGEVDRHRDPP